MSAYREVCSVVELQATFYRLPRAPTADGWRASLPPPFEFSLKAFQGATHPVTSPTWRRAGRQRPSTHLRAYGHLQPTAEVRMAWQGSMTVCRALDANVMVVQLPPSFRCTDANAHNAVKTLTEVERPEIIALEVRHQS